MNKNKKNRVIDFHGNDLILAGNRLGSQQEYTLNHIRNNGQDSLQRAMSLRGKAKEYRSRYVESFRKLALLNPHLLEPGSFGPRGGSGYKWLGQ